MKSTGYISSRDYGLEWLGTEVKASRVKLYTVAASIFFLALQVCAQDEKNESESASRSKALIGEWVKVKRNLSDEVQQWKAKKSAVNDLLSLYRVELSQIEEELTAAGDSLVHYDSETEELKRSNRGLVTQRMAIASKTKEQGERLLKMMRFFPRPLREQVVADEETLKSKESELRGRVLALSNILRSAIKFNESVSYADEINVVNGEERQLKVIYLGLGIAYYTSGDKAGVGVPADNGWRWDEIEGIKPAVSKAMAIFQKTARPELVRLPVEVQK